MNGCDDVNGIIIGGDYMVGQLYYDGRAQSIKFYADSECELLSMVTGRMDQLLAENAGYPCYLYPDSSKWELRIYN